MTQQGMPQTESRLGVRLLGAGGGETGSDRRWHGVSSWGDDNVLELEEVTVGQHCKCTHVSELNRLKRQILWCVYFTTIKRGGRRLGF